MSATSANSGSTFAFTDPMNPEIVVRTRGLSSYDRMYILFVLLGAVFAFLFTLYATLVPLWFQLVLWVCILSSLFLWLENLQGIRRVSVSGQGVAFTYLLHTKFAPWSELSVSLFPQREAAKRGGIYISRSIVDKGKPGLWMHFVTRDQARAILSHTSCPIREIEPGVRAYLGL